MDLKQIKIKELRNTVKYYNIHVIKNRCKAKLSSNNLKSLLGINQATEELTIL